MLKYDISQDPEPEDREEHSGEEREPKEDRRVSQAKRMGVARKGTSKDPVWSKDRKDDSLRAVIEELKGIRLTKDASPILIKRKTKGAMEEKSTPTS